jgi:hypothetical protein
MIELEIATAASDKIVLAVHGAVRRHWRTRGRHLAQGTRALIADHL